jgi:transcriptional regulator with PAS, ATPase and Fis domain
VLRDWYGVRVPIRRPSSNGRSQPRTSPAIAAAIEALAGAALVLDEELHVVAATPAVEALLGFAVPPGANATRTLCGSRTQRPVAEALAAGRPVTALVPHPGTDDTRRLAVRALPLRDDDATIGWLLLLAEGHAADEPGPVLFHGMWTQDPGMKECFRIIERVAAEDVTVLIRGETGAGKELVARALHELSPRRDGPLQAINCAALPPALLESELFGHVRGAFTGAVKDTLGHVQLADKGTLFLDEVAELPLELQAKLLRTVETHSVLPVGGRKPVAVDVRIVSATHRSLRAEVEAGRFRADLMYRLRVIPVFLPALRERPGDIRLLTERFVEELSARGRRQVDQIAPATFERLEAHGWPGNVRELRNVLAYAFAIGDGPVLMPSDLPPEIGVDDEPGTTRVEMPRDDEPSTAGHVDTPEARRILRALQRAGGNRERAARVLGISRVTLWRRIKALGLDA